jgi:hypothetical protein
MTNCENGGANARKTPTIHATATVRPCRRRAESAARRETRGGRLCRRHDYFCLALLSAAGARTTDAFSLQDRWRVRPVPLLVCGTGHAEMADGQMRGAGGGQQMPSLSAMRLEARLRIFKCACAQIPMRFRGKHPCGAVCTRRKVRLCCASRASPGNGAACPP